MLKWLYLLRRWRRRCRRARFTRIRCRALHFTDTPAIRLELQSVRSAGLQQKKRQ